MTEPKKKPRTITPPSAALPADWEVADAAAWQAIHRGDANAWQQQRALKWLLENAALTGDNPYRVDDRETSFACGRMFVGQQVKKMILLNLSAFKETT